MLPSPKIRRILFPAPMRFMPGEASFKHFSVSLATDGNQRGFCLLIALCLHLAGFGLLIDGKAAPDSVPPQPILVEWLTSNPVAQQVSNPQPQKASQALPKAVNKPKALAKPVKQTSLLSAADETTSEMMTAPTEPLQPAAANPAAPQASATTAETAAESSSAPLTLPNLHADYLHNPAPAYPSESRQSGEEGKVLLRVLVNNQGLVEQVSLKKSSGYPRLDQAAQDTVQQWRFVPARRGEQVVSAWVQVPVSFSLEG